MKVNKFVLVGAFLLASSISIAGTVRTIQTDSKTMAPVFLRMGQSTVLRFNEKPKKVILGNSNYYSIEFVENDLAIQPQGAVTTNLFVYGQTNVYGFILRTNQGTSYDDIVQVVFRTKGTTEPVSSETSLATVSKPLQRMKFGSETKILLNKVSRTKDGPLYLFDLSIENLGKADLKLIDFEIRIQANGRLLDTQEFIVKSNILKPNETTTARILASIKVKTDIEFILTHKRLRLKDKVQRKYL